ncbi:MAG: HAMP domain-containing histidine kinase [Chloroflexi bacterium]|nr:MAG: HAMP domain-containing histidine kinase [Chloroflexota bacterium]
MQLNKWKLGRTIAPWIYTSVLATSLVAINVLARPLDTGRPDQFLEILFLVVAAFLMGIPQAQIERGRLDLSAIVNGAAAILANPLDASIVGLVASLHLARRGSWRIMVNAVTYATASCVGAIAAAQFRVGNSLAFGPRLLVVLTVSVVNVGLVVGALTTRTGESVPSIVRHNFTRSFYAAFTYFGLAALLLSYVLDGSPTGYVLAAIVCVLALALTDTIAGRRVRRVLESELSDADRHLFHSRAVEGVVHNLRNHVATAVGYLKEIDPRQLDPVNRANLDTATAAASDAVTVLRSLSQGATPKVSYSPDPVDLNELVTRALSMARPSARAKEVLLAVRESPEEVKVRADPLLMREVITNLLNNAIDAVDSAGHVEMTTGRRGNGWPYFSVADDGPGISDDHRHRLFEPHFTTKETGTGLGLFMSYGIVREHQGDLLYEGGRRGAVFTVTLPPFVV